MTTSSLESNVFPNQRGFKMACLNIASLPKHIDELRILLSDTRLDMLAITETRLNDIVSDDEVSIRGYNIIRKDRNRNGGGVWDGREAGEGGKGRAFTNACVVCAL